MDLLDRPPTGVFPHHLQRLVRVAAGSASGAGRLGPCRARFPTSTGSGLAACGYFWGPAPRPRSTAFHRRRRSAPPFAHLTTPGRPAGRTASWPCQRSSICGSGQRCAPSPASATVSHLVRPPRGLTWIAAARCSPATWYARADALPLSTFTLFLPPAGPAGGDIAGPCRHLSPVTPRVRHAPGQPAGVDRPSSGYSASRCSSVWWCLDDQQDVLSRLRWAVSTANPSATRAVTCGCVEAVAALPGQRHHPSPGESRPRDVRRCSQESRSADFPDVHRQVSRKSHSMGPNSIG